MEVEIFNDAEHIFYQQEQVFKIFKRIKNIPSIRHTLGNLKSDSRYLPNFTTQSTGYIRISELVS